MNIWIYKGGPQLSDGLFVEPVLFYVIHCHLLIHFCLRNLDFFLHSWQTFGGIAQWHCLPAIDCCTHFSKYDGWMLSECRENFTSI